MNRCLAATILLTVFLAVFTPFASSNPDGLEKVAGTLGIEEYAPIWKGLMFDYSVGFVTDSWFSTLFAGIFGTFMVLLATLVLGIAIESKKTPKTSGRQ